MAHYESPSVSVTPRRTAATRGDAEHTVVWLRGEHDAATKTFLASTFARAIELDGGTVLVDLGAVTFIEASTIGVIVAARNRLALRARSLQIRAPSAVAARLLELCRLTYLVRVAPTTAAPSAAAALATWIDVPPTSGTGTPADAASVQTSAESAAS